MEVGRRLSALERRVDDEGTAAFSNGVDLSPSHRSTGTGISGKFPQTFRTFAAFR